jgi:hypothetical protein
VEEIVMRSKVFNLMTLLFLPAAGCVIVNPGEVQFSASPSPIQIVTPSRSDGETPYAGQLKRAIRQQDTVRKELDKRDWEELMDETSDWMEYVRVLNGYAETTSNPRPFRDCCSRLLSRMESLHAAALRRDAQACETALRGCDPLLDQLSRDYPLARPQTTAAHAGGASPAQIP